MTGGGAGIGEGIVRRFSEEGAQVVLADRGSGEATANRVGGLHLPTDVTERAQVEAAVAATVDTYGRIDILVNNASSGMTVSRVVQLVPFVVLAVQTRFGQFDKREECALGKH
ncbi:SDR family NAD(P)-dependent oxidoreductase [Nocardia sp. CA-135398]|uniref:SDR family NAD(P)-dependent oxidoreductase n=1 Tax=Nocardia sp. CA-135398 TaxID=3239977 RepID=UPI003D98A69E